MLPLLGVAGGLRGDVLLVGIDAALAPPGDVLPRLLAELAAEVAVSAVLPPGHAAGGHRAPRPLVVAAGEQEAGADASEVEIGKVTTLLETRDIIRQLRNRSKIVLKAELPAFHCIFDVHILHLGNEVKGAGIAVVILVGAVQVMVDLKKTANVLLRDMTFIMTWV